MGKLATLRVIRQIDAIPEADLIVTAWVDGWSLVVKKDEFQVGDVALYIEVDNLVPLSNPVFAFLEPRGSRTLEGVLYHRLKSIRLKKQLSQGLLIPLEPFEKQGLTFQPHDFDKCYAEELGIIRWDPEVHQPGGAKLAGNALRTFPDKFISKSSQERLQNQTKLLYEDGTFETTVKMEGSSMTVYYNVTDEHYYGVCSRNNQLKLDDPINTDNAFVKTALQYDLHTKLTQLGMNIALQGELMGPGIQGNIENFATNRFFVYDIWDINNQRYFLPKDRRELVAQLGLEHVPVLDEEFVIKGKDLQDMLLYAEGPSLHASQREGVVLKSNTYNCWNSVTSAKIISNRYLLKSKN
jgi:RNA ligase (TIGR02306 family)